MAKLKLRNIGFILMVVGVGLFVIPWMGEYDSNTSLLLLGLVLLTMLAGLAFFIGGLISVIIYYAQVFMYKRKNRKI
jgi:hypothetical protein